MSIKKRNVLSKLESVEIANTIRDNRDIIHKKMNVLTLIAFLNEECEFLNDSDIRLTKDIVRRRCKWLKITLRRSPRKRKPKPRKHYNSATDSWEFKSGPPSLPVKPEGGTLEESINALRMEIKSLRRELFWDRAKQKGENDE